MKSVKYAVLRLCRIPIATTPTYNAPTGLWSEGAALPSQVINDYRLRMRQQAWRWLEPAARRLAGVSVARWKLLLVVLLGAWIVANLARMVWLLLPQHTQPTATAQPVNAIVATPPRAAKSVDIETMAGWHLFGEVGAQPRTAAAEEQAQDTTLNLQLLGVISTSDPAQARAFIMADGQQRQFVVGEQLPGGGKVVLSKVLVDRAIIDNNGRLETLWLYDPAKSALGAPTDSQQAAPAPASRPPFAAPRNGRQQSYQNPANLADVIQVAPANEGGKMVGYRINPGRDQAQFLKFGFKPGDIVTSINNIALDDPQHALEVYNMIRSAREAAITVRRGSDEMTMQVSLDGAIPEPDAVAAPLPDTNSQ